VDQQLWALLQIHVVSRPETTQQASDAVDLSVVQTIETSGKKAMHWLAEVARRAPGLFAH